MIRSRLAQEFLSFASVRLTEGPWRPFHEGVRRAYLGPVAGFLRSALRPKGVSRQDFLLLVRHSATSAEEFNAFQSDLDLSVSLIDSQISESPLVVRRFENLKNVFPFIGELEIYSHSEHRELNILLTNRKSIYSTIRNIRKLSWMEKAADVAQSEYHRLKAVCSIGKILAKENIDLKHGGTKYREMFSDRMNQWLETLSQEFACIEDLGEEVEGLRGISVYSDYLASRIVFSPDVENAKPGELYLKDVHALLLLALTPKAQFEEKNIEPLVRKLRQKPRVNEQWAAISRVECLIFQAVIRGQRSISTADQAWLRGFLESWTASQNQVSS